MNTHIISLHKHNIYMMNKIRFFFYVLIFTLPLSTNAFGDTLSYRSQDIIITANRVALGLSEVGRSVEVITSEELNQLPVQHVQDILKYVEGVQLNRRGPLGAQADVSIRGGSFEQTLIMIDGNKVSDPQTGHHNLDIPLTINDIEQIEILRGVGSRVYGPNAFGGIINVITKRTSKQAVTGTIAGGEHGYFSGGVSMAAPALGADHRLSLSRQSSDGYRANTDFQNTVFSYSIHNAFEKGNYSLQFGYLDKEFGANQYYSASFPDQWEKILTTYLSAGGSYFLDQKSISHRFSAKLHWRNKDDEFLLKRQDPDFYRNTHTTNVWGTELSWDATYGNHKTALVLDLGLEDIESSNLGNRLRRHAGFIAEQHIRLFDRLNVVPGLSLYMYSDWEPEVQPAIDVLLQAAEKLQVFGSVGRAFRVPTYTELYYQDRVNQANEDLKPEEAWAYEIGGRYHEKNWQVSTSVFYRDGRNLIDWVKLTDSDMWQAQNVSNVHTFGLEADVSMSTRMLFKKWISSIGLSYAFINSGRDLKGLQSRYVFQYMKHQIHLKVAQEWFGRLNQLWAIRYQEPKGNDSFMVLDTKLSYPVQIGQIQTTIFAEISNVFNTSYIEVSPIPMPGRWIILGIKPSF